METALPRKDPHRTPQSLFSGKALLEERRRRHFCQLVPVVVMTSSAEERLECLTLGAAGYHLKPMEWSLWQDLIRQIVAQYLAVDVCS